MERLKTSPEREIMPPDIFRHYIDSRKKAYAGGGENVYIPDANLSDFKVFNWQNPDLPYHFEDHYTDSPERPGNFAGFEIIREKSSDGKRLTFYDYSGGLTEEGMRLGEGKIYSRLINFLGNHAEDVRFGKNVNFDFEDDLGKWTYEGKAEVPEYGWHDEELISRNGILVYKLRGNGICFVPGF